MKTLRLLFFLALLGSTFLGIKPARADHLMGSDIAWKCLGKDTFLVTVTVYRDCNGISMPDQSFNLLACGKTSNTLVVSTKLSGGKDITPVCKKSCTRCGKKPNTNYGDPKCSFPYGIEQYFFTAKVVLTKKYPSCCDFTISWEQCCRSGTLTAGGNWQNFHVEASLNRCSKPCDNSPYFTNPPVAILCTNQCITYNNGVNDDDIDANGNSDSLVFYFAKPMAQSNSPVTFNSPYTWDKPLKFDQFPNKAAAWNPPNCYGFHMDSATGDIQFKAKKADQTVLTIQVEEWGKDASGKPFKKGITRRDMQLIVVDCKNNKIPELSGVDGTNINEVEICANSTKCFTINSYDPDQKDTVTVKWNNGIPGATFTVEPKKQFPRSTFCWTPGNDKVRSYPYQFVVNAQDDACPVNGRTSRSFRVRVRPSPEVTIIDTIYNCGDVGYWATPKAGSSVKDYVWSGDDKLLAYGPKTKHHYRKAGTYKWFLTTINAYGCTSQDSGQIIIAPYVTPELPPDTTLCLGDTNKIILFSSTTLGAKPYRYRWNTGDTSSFIVIKPKKDTSYYMEVFDAIGCKNSDTMQVKIKTPITPSLGPPQRLCNGATAYLGDTTMTENHLTYSWYNAANPSVQLGTQTSINVRDSGDFVMRTRDSVGCYGYGKAHISFNLPIDVQPRLYKGCQAQLQSMDAGTGDSTSAIWTWMTLDNPPVVIGTGKKLTYRPYKDETFLVTAVQTYQGTYCADSDTISIRVNPKPALFVNTIPNQCLNYPPIDLSSYTNLQGGIWTGPGVVKNKFTPSVAGKGTHALKYYYKSPTTGCDSSVTQNITIDPIPIIKIIKDTFVCAETPLPFNMRDMEVSPTGGVWSGNGITGNAFNPSDPDVHPNTTVTLYYDYTDNLSAAKCSNRDTAKIQVISLPRPKGVSFNTCDGWSPRQLQGNSPNAKSVRWYMANSSDPAAITQNGPDYFFDPVVSGAGTFKVVLESSHIRARCPKMDTITVTVNPSPAISYTGPSSFCVKSGPVEMTVSSSVPGSKIFVGKGVTGKYFDPSKADTGVHNIKLIVTSANGCSKSINYNLYVYPTPSVDIQLSKPVYCADEQVHMEAQVSAGSKFDHWKVSGDGKIADSLNPKTFFTPGYNNIHSGSFTLTAYVKSSITGSPCGVEMASKSATITPLPDPKFAPDRDEACEPFTVSLLDSSKFVTEKEYVWGDGSPNTLASGKGTVRHTYTHYGVYHPKVFVKTVASCAAVSAVPDVTVHQLPVVDFLANPTYTTISLPNIQFTDVTQLEEPGAKKGASYYWDFGDGEKIIGQSEESSMPYHNYRDTGYYTVTHGYTSAYGCQGSLTKKEYINIRPEILVFIPNAFTPNKLFNDRTKVNEKFTPVVSNEGSYELNVFNRWGEVMYTTTDKTAGWDGTFMNEAVEEGVYVYVLKVTSLTGKKYKYTGSITLLR